MNFGLNFFLLAFAALLSPALTQIIPHGHGELYCRPLKYSSNSCKVSENRIFLDLFGMGEAGVYHELKNQDFPAHLFHLTLTDIRSYNLSSLSGNLTTTPAVENLHIRHSPSVRHITKTFLELLNPLHLVIENLPHLKELPGLTKQVKSLSVNGFKPPNILVLNGTNVGSAGKNMRKIEFTDSFVDQVGHDAFSSMNNLTNLTIYNSSLLSVHPDAFRGFNHLVALNVSRNKLVNDSLHFGNTTRRTLKTLDVSGNYFQSVTYCLEPNMTQFGALEFFNMSRNGVLELNSNVFRGMHNLTVVDFSNNYLIAIKFHAFGNLNSLETIDLSHNDYLMTLVPEGFFHLPSIKTIDLSNNKELRYIEKGTFTNLKGKGYKINLSRGKLATLGSGIFSSMKTGLETLDLSHNEITKLSPNIFDPHGELDKLDLSWNRIKNAATLHLGQFWELKTLNLAHNQLTKIGTDDFKDMDKLTELDLSFNDIMELSDDCFSQMRVSLHVLNLQGNSLTKFDPDTYGSLANVTFLNLSHNKLRGFYNTTNNREVSSFHHLAEVDLSHNQLTGRPPMFPIVIRRVDLSWNKLNNLRFPAPTLIANLDASYNNLVQSYIYTENLYGLQNISLQGTFSQEQRFKQPTPEELEAIDNDITILAKQLLEEPDMFSSSGGMSGYDILRSLEFLYDQGWLALKHVDLSNNPLSSFSSYTFYPKVWQRIESLNLTNCSISSFQRGTFENAHKLETLIVSDNNIRMIRKESLKGLYALKNLNLDWNDISLMEGSKETPHLKHLNISHNSIRTLAGVFEPNEETNLLETFHASHNYFSNLSQILPRNHSFPALNTLDVSHNNIGFLDEFASMCHLKTMDLSFNQLAGEESSSAIASMVQPLSELEDLNLSYNKLDEYWDEFDNEEDVPERYLPFMAKNVAPVPDRYLPFMANVAKEKRPRFIENLDLSGNPMQIFTPEFIKRLQDKYLTTRMTNISRSCTCPDMTYHSLLGSDAFTCSTTPEYDCRSGLHKVTNVELVKLPEHDRLRVSFTLLPDVDIHKVTVRLINVRRSKMFTATEYTDWSVDHVHLIWIPRKIGNEVDFDVCIDVEDAWGRTTNEDDCYPLEEAKIEYDEKPKDRSRSSGYRPYDRSLRRRYM